MRSGAIATGDHNSPAIITCRTLAHETELFLCPNAQLRACLIHNGSDHARRCDLVVEAYLDAISRNDLAARPLHPDVEFISPLNSYKGIAAFKKGLADFFPILKSVEVTRFDRVTNTPGIQNDLRISAGVVLSFGHR